MILMFSPRSHEFWVCQNNKADCDCVHICVTTVNSVGVCDCASGEREDLLAPVLNFFHSMASLGVTEAEYALLTATSILCSGEQLSVILFYSVSMDIHKGALCTCIKQACVQLRCNDWMLQQDCKHPCPATNCICDHMTRAPGVSVMCSQRTAIMSGYLQALSVGGNCFPLKLAWWMFTTLCNCSGSKTVSSYFYH